MAESIEAADNFQESLKLHVKDGQLELQSSWKQGLKDYWSQGWNYYEWLQIIVRFIVESY
jgi:hypothetical protein